MRNRQALLFLLALAVLLLAANVLLWRDGRGARSSGRQMLVENADSVCGIHLMRRGGPDVRVGMTGSHWCLIEPYFGSADEQAVMRFIDALSMTPVSDVLLDSSLLKLGRTHADFSLDDPPISVELTLENGNRELLGFGIKTPLQDGVYVSIGGIDSVFVVSTSVWEVVDVDANSFRRRALFTIGESAVTAFGIKRGSAPPLELSRAEGGWRIGSAPASAAKVSEFLSRITSASAESFVWPVGASNETAHASAALLAGYGLDPDAAVTVAFKCSDGTDRRVSFGKEASAGKVYALIHGGMAIVTLPESLKALAEQDAVMFTDLRIFPVDSRAVAAFSVLDRDVLYAFARGKDAGWTIESPIVARADGETVDGVLSRILSLSASDADEDGVAVALSTNAAKAVVSRASVFGGISPEDLRSREVMRIDPALVKRIVRADDSGAAPVSVVYDRERKSWNVEEGVAGRTPDSGGIEALLSAVRLIEAVKVEKLRVPASDLDDYGLDRPYLTVAVDLEVDAAVRRNIMVGKRTKGGRFATIGASDAVFVIGEATIRGLTADIVGK